MVLSEIARAFTSDDEDLQIYTSGATNIFKYPELSDGEKASKLIDAFEQKEKLKRIFDQTQIAGNDYGIQVYIGEELPVQNMQDCSLVTAKYESVARLALWGQSAWTMKEWFRPLKR